MTTVPHLHHPSNPTYYAAYLDLDGIAQRVSGGWLFLEDGTDTVITVDVHNPDLMLFGNCALADAQREVDGDLVVTTSRMLGR